MTVYFNKKFLEELSALPVRDRAKVEKLVFQEIHKYQIFRDIPGLGKLKGYKDLYKIRIRNLNRKDIYRFYP